MGGWLGGLNMKRMSKLEIDIAADRMFNKMLAGLGIANGKKLAHRIWKMFQAEEKRMKANHPKE